MINCLECAESEMCSLLDLGWFLGVASKNPFVSFIYVCVGVPNIPLKNVHIAKCTLHHHMSIHADLVPNICSH